MAELMRVARDGLSIIAKVGEEYVSFSTDGTMSAPAADLKSLTASGSWRRPLAGESEKRADELTLIEGGVVASVPVATSTRTFRVPPSVRRSIADALESYSAIMAEEDRAIAQRLASHTSVSKSDIEWMHRFYTNVEKAFALHGGKRGQAWAAKALSASEDETLVASAFEADESLTYFAGGDDPDSTDVDTLYAVRYDDEGEMWDEDDYYVWQDGAFVPIEFDGEPELERELIIELDDESAKVLADFFTENPGTPVTVVPEDGAQPVASPDARSGEAPFALSSMDPFERNLFALAEAEIDWEFVDRFAAITADATGYSPAERAQNAQRQPRAQGGRFGGAPAPVGDTIQVIAKARLAEELVPVEDINALIDDYLAGSTSAPTEEPAPVADEPVTAAGLPEGTPDPLYLAIVDATDKTAVLDALALVPNADGSEADAYIRRDGEWQASPETITDLRGTTPPTVVKLDNEDVVKDVLTQIDEHDGETVEDAAEADAAGPQTPEAVAASAADFSAESTRLAREDAARRGFALPDGSFPILASADLVRAVDALSLANDQDAARRHIKRRARALNRMDVVPSEWKSFDLIDPENSPLYGPFGEVILAAGVPGIADTPSDKAAVNRLREYWTHGAGAAKIRWGTPGDLTRAHRELAKYVGPERAWGLAQNYHKYLFGVPNETRDRAAGER